MRARINNRTAILLVMVMALLLAVSVLAVSCGKKTTVTREASSGTTTTGISEVDSFTSESDAAINSAKPEDFSDSQLSDSALGL
ncbi:MAG: hypothetical protein MUO75_04815 [Actinobacteria bacterium]|nr:hypothetical protein [Actinomycetota bacterium]